MLLPKLNIKSRGLTLIELMVTVAVLSVIAAIAIPAYRGYISTGYRAECQNEVSAIRLAEEEFFLQNNSYFTGAVNGASATDTMTDGGLYTPTSQASSATANCTYSVVATCGAKPVPCYTITATGANKLSGTIVTYVSK